MVASPTQLPIYSKIDDLALEIGLTGFLGNYWSINSDIEVWSIERHMNQVNMTTYLTNMLMTVDLEEIRPL